MRKKIFLIGSCGFLLSNLLRKNLFLKERDHFYVGLDKLTEKHSSYNRYQHHFYHHYLGDVADEYLLKQIFLIEKPNIVIFGPDVTQTIESLNKEHCLARTKINGLTNLINLSGDFNVERIIYLSHTNIYGATADNVTENSLVSPLDYPSAIDCASEQLLRYNENIPYNIVRISHVFGQRLNFQDWIFQAMHAAFSNDYCELTHQGLQEFDYLYIDDFCSGMNSIIEFGNKNEIYNLSSGQSISQIEVLNEIFKSMNKDLSYIKYKSDSREKEFHKINSDKLQKLNWKPNLKWRFNIKETVAWYNSNQWMFKLHDKSL